MCYIKIKQFGGIKIDNIIIIVIGFLASFIAVITPIIKLNSSITSLTSSIKTMGSDINQIKQDLQAVKDKNHEQEIKIVKLEERKDKC